MFEKNILYVLFFLLLPNPEKLHFFSENLYFNYFNFFKKIKSKVVAYHKTQLMFLDDDYKNYVESLSLVRRRNEALEKGIDPMDPAYPRE